MSQNGTCLPSPSIRTRYRSIVREWWLIWTVRTKPYLPLNRDSNAETIRTLSPALNLGVCRGGLFAILKSLALTVDRLLSDNRSTEDSDLCSLSANVSSASCDDIVHGLRALLIRFDNDCRYSRTHFGGYR